ncbi:MAG TPA: twin-arginine translocase TatA/TatE family subunit [Candidatus Limnocylindrales bacterium]|nr:twin-arginine translocase TatA/TatE family subunit [Candidatus Limnocylindrales bacterium]
MPFNIGPVELIIVLVIALLVLGPGKLPEVGSALGKSIREFRKAASDVQDATRLDNPTGQSTPVSPTPVAPPASPTAPAAVQPVGTTGPAAGAPAPNTLSGQAQPNEITTGSEVTTGPKA